MTRPGLPHLSGRYLQQVVPSCERDNEQCSNHRAARQHKQHMAKRKQSTGSWPQMAVSARPSESIGRNWPDVTCGRMSDGRKWPCHVRPYGCVGRNWPDVTCGRMSDDRDWSVRKRSTGSWPQLAVSARPYESIGRNWPDVKCGRMSDGRKRPKRKRSICCS